VVREDGSTAMYGALNHVSQRQIVEARAGVDGRYRMLAEEASDVVLETDTRGRILWVSDSIETVAGWPPEQLVATAAVDLLDPGDRAVARHLEPLIYAGSSRSGIVLRLRTAEGPYRFVSATVRPARGDGGAVTGAIVGWRDVDDVMRARLEAESERQILRATIDSQLDPQVLVEAIRDGGGAVVDFRFVEVNPAACASIKKRRDELVGLPLSVVDPVLSDSQIVPSLVASLGSGEPLVVNDHPFRHSSGRTARYDVRAVPVHDGLSVTWREVSQRYDASVALAESEARSRLLLEESSDIVTFHAPDGTVQWVSPAIERLLGWEVGAPDRLLGLIHRDDGAAVAGALERLRAGEESAAVRLRMRTHSGGFRWMQATARAVRDRRGEVLSLVVITHDIQEQMDYERALARSEERYRLLAENATDVVYRTDPHGITEWVSEGVVGVLGFTPAEVIGCDARSLICHEDRDIVTDAAREAMTSRRASVRFRMQTKGGDPRWVEATIHPVHRDGAPVGFVGGWRDVQPEVEAEAELDLRARTDDLTGLLNRREALGQLGVWLAPDNPERARLAVAFCDLDAFKEINDRLGHAAGDGLLQRVADRVRGCVRSQDLVARVGGDELLIVLRGVQDLDAATGVAEKIRLAVREPLRVDGQAIVSTVSIGVAMAGTHDDVDALVARADRAMYEAKQAGRDQVVPVL
jgi:diguanylate cyclase (GGDEF)-like protein/PAS domain S-box-containing protein